MKIKTSYLIIIGLIILIVLNKNCESKRSKKFKENIEKLEKQRDSIKSKNIFLIKNIDSLNNLIEDKELKIVIFNKKIDSLKTKRNEVPINVSNMDELELDSILTNYRAPKRD